MAPFVTVLWEDQRGTQRPGFGPDELLRSIVAHRRETDVAKWANARHALAQRVKAHPLKGNTKVLGVIKAGLDKRFRGPVIAVFDDDRVRELLELPAAASATTVLDTIDHESEQLRVVLLEDNIETVVKTCLEVRRKDLPAKKPTPDERDIILAAAAADRTCLEGILERMPSLQRLVEYVEHFL